jgi:DNA-binding NarL/FixJ family response regulator
MILSPAVLHRLIGHAAGGTRRRHELARAELDRLSERERDVAACIGRAASNAEIAAQLHLSVATVKAHVTRILTTLGLNNRVQIALLAHDAADD